MEKNLPEGFVTDGSVDYSSAVQDAIDKHAILQFPPFPILINEKGLKLKSNSTIIFSRNSKILLKSNSLTHYSVLNLIDLENVNIFYPTIIGDRKSHFGNSGEWGMGITIKGSKNVRLIYPNISSCWGDGIYITHSKRSSSENILIDHAMLDYNRRNGITIISGQNVKITNAIISNTHGTLPMSGIDIEPNDNKSTVNNVLIKSSYLFNNGGSGLQLGLSRLPGVSRKTVNVQIEDTFVEMSGFGVVVGGFKKESINDAKVQGVIKLDGLTVLNADVPIKLGNHNSIGPAVQFRKVKFLNSDSSGRILSNFKEIKLFEKRISSKENVSFR